MLYPLSYERGVNRVWPLSWAPEGLLPISRHHTSTRRNLIHDFSRPKSPRAVLDAAILLFSRPRHASKCGLPEQALRNGLGLAVFATREEAIRAANALCL